MVVMRRRKKSFIHITTNSPQEKLYEPTGTLRSTLFKLKGLMCDYWSQPRKTLKGTESFGREPNKYSLFL